MIAHACLGDDTIAAMLEGGLADDRARIARAHIGGCADCRRLVSAAIERPSAAASTAIPTSVSPLAAGATIGNYRLERVIGEGGMGRVFEARQLGLERRVAIKVLLPELARDAVALERFQREARVVSSLHSEHVVGVHDLGVAAGQPYLVMEHLEGEDLGAMAARGPIATDRAIAWITAACEALAEAHALGIVHRDLKPSNLFVTRQGRLVVLDFGLAKLAAARTATMTGDGIVIGSPRYIAPEQITGARDVDGRADIWSLAATLYHLITGRLPFPATSLEGIFAEILAGGTPPLAGIPPAIAAAIARGLARDPAARYASVRDFAAALRTPVGVDDRFEILDLLGEGGHGAVYRARQKPGGREVALKLLRGGVRERFTREAAIVQRLEHPNTVRLYESGVAGDGTAFMVFELVRGRTLASELRRGSLAPARVNRIATQVLKALAEAHGQGIVHRDVTPANILLVDFVGDPDFVKLLDFGVAVDHESPRLTATGQTLGTPRYMAPEQVLGGHVDPRADLYALGLVLAEALTAVPVFAGESAIAVCMQQASADPVPLPHGVLAGPLGEVIAKATAKRADDRFATALDMLAMIERGPVGTAVVAAPAPVPVIATRRNAVAPVIWLLLAGFVIAGVTIVVVAWKPWATRAEPTPSPPASGSDSVAAGQAFASAMFAKEPAPPTGALANVDEARLRARLEKLGWRVEETFHDTFPACTHTRLRCSRGNRWAEVLVLDCYSTDLAASERDRLRNGFPSSWFTLDGTRLLDIATPEETGSFASAAASKQLTEALLTP